VKENDFDKFHDIMTVLASAVNGPLSEKREAVYFKLLNQYPIEAIESAANRISRSWKIVNTFPPIAEFVEAIEGAADEKASKAWYDYLEAIKRVGPERSIDLGDRFAHAVIKDLDLWGIAVEEKGEPWNRISGTILRRCSCEPDKDGSHSPECQGGEFPVYKDESSFIRAEFIKRYKYHLSHSHPRTLPERLIGSMEYRNLLAIQSGADRNWSDRQKEFASKSGATVQFKELTSSPRPAIGSSERKALSAPEEEIVRFEEVAEEVQGLINSFKRSNELEKSFVPADEEEIAARKERMKAAIQEAEAAK